MGGLFGVPNGFMGLDHLVTTIIQVGCNPSPAPWKPWLPRAAWEHVRGAPRPFSEVNERFAAVSSSGAGLRSPSRDAARPYCVPTRRVGARKHTKQARETGCTHPGEWGFSSGARCLSVSIRLRIAPP
jgi:hypothetical protein